MLSARPNAAVTAPPPRNDHITTCRHPDSSPGRAAPSYRLSTSRHSLHPPPPCYPLLLVLLPPTASLHPATPYTSTTPSSSLLLVLLPLTMENREGIVRGGPDDERGKGQACFVGSHLSWWSSGHLRGNSHLHGLILQGGAVKVPV